MCLNILWLTYNYSCIIYNRWCSTSPCCRTMHGWHGHHLHVFIRIKKDIQRTPLFHDLTLNGGTLWLAGSLSLKSSPSPFRLPAKLMGARSPILPMTPVRSAMKENTGCRHRLCQRTVQTTRGRSSIYNCICQNSLGSHTCHMLSDLPMVEVIQKCLRWWRYKFGTHDSNTFARTIHKKDVAVLLPMRTRGSPFQSVRWTA